MANIIQAGSQNDVSIPTNAESISDNHGSHNVLTFVKNEE